MLKILKRNIESLHDPLTPEQIVEISPPWKNDIEKFSPWESTAGGDYLTAGKQLESGIIVAGECCSTFDLADRLIGESELDEWESVIAVSQRAGRGRRKSHWISPPGNLYVSLVLPEIPAEWQTLASLLSGFCLSEGLNQLGCETAVKWPNDILQNRKKVAGILIEQKAGQTVVGVGINLINRPENQQLEGPGAFPAGCLWESAGRAVEPVSLWDFLVKRFKKLYYGYTDGGTVENFIDTVQPQLEFIEEEVMILEAGEVEATRAVFSGINSSGFARFLIDGQPKILRDAKILPD